MNFITVNPGKTVGKIRPMNAVNNLPVPFTPTYDAALKAMRIPAVRTHDASLMNPHLVDIPALFPNFDADENDPASYDFAMTDVFVKHIADVGSVAFFRLGVSIENYAYIKPYNIVPPADFHKWARICEHVIAHYNEGWANGFHYGITYWEIWNEPENHPDRSKNPMWTGTFEEYIDLYVITANHLKKRFPGLKIGGYASCGFYYALNKMPDWSAGVSDRIDYFIECFDKFMKAIASEEKKAPLDFFSWHSYADTESTLFFVKHVRGLLDKYGFTETESILNEWNPSTVEASTLKNASEICATMLGCHKNGLDMLMYYDLRGNTSYCGVFDRYTFKPFKAYSDFVWFADLADLGNEVETVIEGDNLFALAAFDGSKGKLLFNNDSDETKFVEIKGVSAVENIQNLSGEPLVREGMTFAMPPREVMILDF